MKRISFIHFSLLISAALLTGCGELFEVEEVPEQTVVADVELGRRSVDLMTGDSYELTATITPDSLISKGIYWEVADTNVVRIVDGTITAKAPGETTVKVTALAGMKRDSCRVRVYHWNFDPYQFRYDMVIYANVTVGGQPAEAGTMVAAFGHSETGAPEMRGIGVMRQSAARQYMQLRLYSNEAYGDELTFRCYDRRRLLMVDGNTSVSFEESATLGTLSMLYNIAFD